jgi:hypothetical protein
MQLIHQKPPAHIPDDNNPHNILLVYMHELKKADMYRRRLRVMLGNMQSFETKYFNHVVNAGIKNRPDIRNCIAQLHECGRKWLLVRQRFHFLAKYKHFYVEPGVIEENQYQIEPKVVYVKRSS